MHLRSKLLVHDLHRYNKLTLLWTGIWNSNFCRAGLYAKTRNKIRCFCIVLLNCPFKQTVCILVQRAVVGKTRIFIFCPWATICKAGKRTKRERQATNSAWRLPPHDVTDSVPLVTLTPLHLSPFIVNQFFCSPSKKTQPYRWVRTVLINSSSRIYFFLGSVVNGEVWAPFFFTCARGFRSILFFVLTNYGLLNV